MLANNIDYASSIPAIAGQRSKFTLENPPILLAKTMFLVLRVFIVTLWLHIIS
jgi:hypothetical protein